MAGGVMEWDHNEVKFRTRRVPAFGEANDQGPPKSTETASALDVQVGGGHYKEMAIQPIEFVMKNNLNFIQGNIIKYITRYKTKNGREDLEKVKHYVDLLIEMEYGDG